jgi:hypothetical protein
MDFRFEIMTEVSINKQARLSQHFTLGELCKTSAKTQDGNIPSHVHIENLKRLCGWLEELRERYNRNCAGVQTTPAPPNSGGEPSGQFYPPESKEASDRILPLSRGSQRGSEEPVIINSGYRSPEVNQKCGGARNSNHLTGCAVDIRCKDKAQAIRYGCILLDIADGKKLDFDELILEKRGTTIWVHFAVRPKVNRRYVDF